MASGPPVVSVVTPSFNQGEFIEQTIRSVLAQDYQHVEYVVVDGGSTDGTLEVLKRYHERLRWISEPDRGQCDALNKGFAMIHGDIAGWLNSDDMYFDRHVISAAVEELARRPEIGFVYGDFAAIDVASRLMFARPVPEFSRGRLRRYNYIPQPTIFCRRAVMQEYALNTEYRVGLDTEWLLRLTGRYEGRRIPRLQAAFRHHANKKWLAGGSERYWIERRMLQTAYPFHPAWARLLYRAWDKVFSVQSRLVGRRWQRELARNGAPYLEFVPSRPEGGALV